MIIRNLTSKPQKLHIRNILTGDTSMVDVLATEPRELGRAYIPDKSMMKDFDQLFEMVGYPRQAKKEEPIVNQVEETVSVPEVVEQIQETESISTAEVTQVPTTLEDKFICDICGEEFASARGLTAHKNRSHKE